MSAPRDRWDVPVTLLVVIGIALVDKQVYPAPMLWTILIILLIVALIVFIVNRSRGPRV